MACTTQYTERLPEEQHSLFNNHINNEVQDKITTTTCVEKSSPFGPGCQSTSYREPAPTATEVGLQVLHAGLVGCIDPPRSQTHGGEAQYQDNDNRIKRGIMPPFPY